MSLVSLSDYTRLAVPEANSSGAIHRHFQGAKQLQIQMQTGVRIQPITLLQ